MLLLPRAGQQLVHLSLPWRFPCEQRFFVVFNLQPSALPVLLARAPCSLLHGQQRPATPFFPSSTFPRALSPWPSSPRLPWPSVPTSSAPSLLPVSTLHSALWKAAALQLRAFPMAPPLCAFLPGAQKKIADQRPLLLFYLLCSSAHLPWKTSRLPASGKPHLFPARELAAGRPSRCSPRPHLHGRAPPLQRASPFPSLRSSSAKRRCSCSHGVQVPAPSPPIQKKNSSPAQSPFHCSFPMCAGCSTNCAAASTAPRAAGLLFCAQ
jgi:hypothetical protein